MAVKKDVYVCGSCSYETGKWMGFCPQCRTADSLSLTSGSAAGSGLNTVSLEAARSDAQSTRRIATGLGELDRVLGEGVVPGSVTLLGGDPGIGKSTLMLQAAATLGASHAIAYITGEESVAQVADRAVRVGADGGGLVLAAERDADVVAASVRSGKFAVAVIDSIQTMNCADLDSGTGGVSQLRESSARIIAAAKHSGTAVFLVGHVTKDGSIAGPRQVEHMVDVVLHLEGEAVSGLRYLRGVKNRFGSVDRVGIFAMDEDGMRDVADPTALLAGENRNSPGSVLFPAIHGRRALLLEVQALVAPSPVTNPRRSIRGIENARVHQIIAVLERHVGFRFHDREVFVSVVGGLRISDPAVDLPVALALASSHSGRAVSRLVAFGEVGLTGEIRPAQRTEARLEEARRLGDVDIASTGAFATIADAIAAAGLQPAGTVVPLRAERT
jgi:DNA repair protein RadA/Sms